MPKILIVDDEPEVRWLLSTILVAEGYEVAETEKGEAALDRVLVDPPAAVILDVKMPGLDGIQVLEKLRVIAPEIPVIVLTGHGDIPGAVRATRLGAYHYLTKPFCNEDILSTVAEAIGRHPRVTEIAALGKLRNQMGPSKEILQVIQRVAQVAESNWSVLIQGETGTGKELVARAIHQQSTRCDKPFVALDCGAIPETLIESELFGYERGAFTGATHRKEGHFQTADHGTLFLDEIVNLPLPTQAKLLRVLQERQVLPLGAKHPVRIDVRIIAASNILAIEEMQARRFRPDLYYRLSEFLITVPPLRDRREDIPYLAQRFLDEACAELDRPVGGISQEAAQMLLRHPWPGNVRELRNVIREAVLLTPGVIRPEHLPLGAAPRSETFVGDRPPDAEQLSLREVADKAAGEAERAAICAAIWAAQGNRSKAARILQIDYKTLYRKMKRHGLKPTDFLAS